MTILALILLAVAGLALGWYSFRDVLDDGGDSRDTSGW